MKITLEFNDDDGADAAQTAIDGWKWKLSYEEALAFIRNAQKHRDDLDPKTLDELHTLLVEGLP